MIRSLRANWPEYLMEGAELGLFMILAGVFATLLYSPTSPVVGMLSGSLRDVMM